MNEILIRNTVGIILKGEDRCTRRKACTSATLSIKITSKKNLESNSAGGLRLCVLITLEAICPTGIQISNIYVMEGQLRFFFKENFNKE
jgi:hypothetical protein